MRLWAGEGEQSAPWLNSRGWRHRVLAYVPWIITGVKRDLAFGFELGSCRGGEPKLLGVDLFVFNRLGCPFGFVLFFLVLEARITPLGRLKPVGGAWRDRLTGFEDDLKVARYATGPVLRQSLFAIVV
jgi:hypothetical protein